MSRFSQNRNKEGWYSTATSTLRTPWMALPEDRLRSKHISLLAQQRRDNIRRWHSISWHPNDNPRNSLRRKFLDLLHKGHLGEEKNLLLARTTIYWPNYTDDIRQTVRNCQACQSTRCSQQQEGLSQYEVPAGPWKRLGIDYFEWNQQRYLLIADYYSRFHILRSVSTMSAAHLVTVLKTKFSEYGLPEELVSDQGTQFTSEQYTSFAEEYNIKITHSSPRYPQSNGFIVSMVKITKQILERCKQTSSDPHIAMLLYRATPLQSGMASPAELLSQRRYQTTLPIKNKEPVRNRNHRETMAKSRDKREEY